jgi:hypothetical protein
VTARSAFGFSPREVRALRALDTPYGVQRALDAMPYHLASTAWSPRRVLREGTAHCLEGAGYINLRGDRTLRAYSRPVNLARFDRRRSGWMTSEEDLWWVAEHLVGVRRTPLLRPAMVGRLHRVDRRSLDTGLVGYRAR